MRVGGYGYSWHRGGVPYPTGQITEILVHSLSVIKKGGDGQETAVPGIHRAEWAEWPLVAGPAAYSLAPLHTVRSRCAVSREIHMYRERAESRVASGWPAWPSAAYVYSLSRLPCTLSFIFTL
jgi:hypothetical protein